MILLYRGEPITDSNREEAFKVLNKFKIWIPIEKIRGNVMDLRKKIEEIENEVLNEEK